MVIDTNLVKKSAILYLAVPIFIFLVAWNRPLVAIVCGGSLLGAIYFSFKVVNKQEVSLLKIKKRTAFKIALIIMIWVFLSGIGGYFFQTSDHGARNAIFRDLINYSWPVVYDNDMTLTYYIGYWLIPALFGKLALLITGSASIAWTVGSFALYAFTCTGISIVFLQISSYLKRYTDKDFWIVILALILFSGLDVLGILLKNDNLSFHLEPWAVYYQYSSNTTQLFWVFNQAIPAWIGTMLIVGSKSIEIDVFIGVLLILFSPLPLIGCFLICSIKVFSLLLKSSTGGVVRVVKDVISISNCLSIIILPVVFTFIRMNNSLSRGGGPSGFNLNIGELNYVNIIVLVAFWLLEFGIYLLFIYKNQKHNYLFYCCLIFLPIICMFRIGSRNDFEMRASIPMLFVLMVLVINELQISLCVKKSEIAITKKGALLVLILLIGSITPITEMYRGYYHVRQEKRLGIVEDGIYTLRIYDRDTTFTKKNYQESNYYKYFMKV